MHDLNKTSSQSQAKRILAVASDGGHWIQLLRLRAALKGHRITFASVGHEKAADVSPAPYKEIIDGNRDTKFKIVLMAVQMCWLVVRTRPDVVITTGAAQGYFACRFGRLFGARTLFIDSVANANELSLSARLSVGHAHRVYSQWDSVAAREGVDFHGNCL